MPLPFSSSFSFSTAADYKSSLPAYVPKSDTNVTKNYIGKVYNNKSKTIKLSTTDYGYVTFDVLYTGSAEIASITFESNIGEISVGSNIDDLFVPFSDGKPVGGYDIKLTSGVTKRLYVIVNGDQTNKTNLLKIHTSIGVISRSSGLTSSTTVSYDCYTPLYKYNMGLHAYSAWDSINSPKLTTNLYSRTPITSWSTDTKVWSKSSFDHPAFPYYYGYSSTGKVYKVGGELDRAYGIKKRKTVKQTAWRAIRGISPSVTDFVYGPQKWPSLSVSDGTDACVNVFMSGIGLVKEVITASTIVQPQKYKYYMGYHASSRQNSNDNHFQKYVETQENFYAVTGETHAGLKMSDGFVKGFDTDLSLGLQAGIAIGAGISIVAGFFAGPILASFVVTGGCFIEGVTFTYSAAAALAGTLGPLAIVLGIIVLIVALVVLNSSKDYNENACPSFLHHYTTTPYIENGSVLSRNVLLTTNNNGHYSDGVYFYQQSGGVISSKTLSSSPKALLTENPLKLSFQNSLQADTPVLVERINKLLLLPYTSGKPIPYCGEGNPIYYSEAFNETITLTECAELTTNPGSVSLTLEASSSVSCISGVDANNKALITWNKAKSNAVAKYSYSSTLSGNSLGSLESAFTHELKVETTPNNVNAFYNNINGAGLTIGKKLFYDFEGRYEVANGFYAVSGTSPYRTFYQTLNAAVTNIYTMASSGSTTVTDSSSNVFSLVTTDLNHTSDWYFYELDDNSIHEQVQNANSTRCYDINSAISSSFIRRGYVTSDLKTSLKLFPSNTAITTIEAGISGWYQPISKWGITNPFYYNSSQTIAINSEEICLVSYPTNNQLYGFYIFGTTASFQTPLYNEVRLTANVYRDVSGSETFVASYPITASSSDVKTYVPYGNVVSASYDITAIKIASIDSTNPINKINYITGSFTNCINPSPSVTPTPSMTVTPTVTPSISRTPSITPSRTPAPSITPSVTPSSTPSLTATPSVTPTPSISITPSRTPSLTPTPSISLTPSVTPSRTPTPSITPTRTPTPTPSPSMIMYKYYFELQSPNGVMTLNATGNSAAFSTNYNLILAGQNQYNLVGSTITANPTYYIDRIERYVPYNVNPTTVINLGVSTLSYTFGTLFMNSGGVQANEFETIKVYFGLIPSPSPSPSITPSRTPAPSITPTPTRTPSITPTPSKLYATVILNPQNSLNGDSYVVYINGVGDGTWKSGSRSYEQGTTIAIYYNNPPACNVTLNGSGYTGGTSVSLNGNSSYSFQFLNADHYVDYGTPYCMGNIYRQGTINDCGTQSSYVVDDCSCACNQACNGTYYSDYICVGTTKRFIEKYYCNNAATGNTNDVTCSGDCGASTSQVASAASIGNYHVCNGGVTIYPVYPNINTCYTGPNIYYVNGAWQSTNPSNAAPNTDPVWVNTGGTYCIAGSCTTRQNQTNTNPCSSATTQTINTGVTNESCGTWDLQYYCVNNESPFEYRSREVNGCTGGYRNDTFISYNSPECGYVPPTFTAFSISGISTSYDVCTVSVDQTAYCAGGTPYNGIIVYANSNGTGPLAEGYYNTYNGYIYINGSGAVDGSGIC